MKSFFISTELVVVSLHKIGCGSAKIASKLASLRSPCTIFAKISYDINNATIQKQYNRRGLVLHIPADGIVRVWQC